MAEVWYIALAGNVIAFLAVWWRLRNPEGLEVALEEQKKIAEELRHSRALAHGEIWKLAGRHRQVNLCSLRREMDGVLQPHFEGIAVPKVGGIGSVVPVRNCGEAVAAWAEDCANLIMGFEKSLGLPWGFELTQEIPPSHM